MPRTEPEPSFDPVAVELGGKNLIEASAGTGKTYAITTLFVRFLLEAELEPAQILVVTFTDAATAELRQRTRARLLDARAAFVAVQGGGSPKDGDLARLARDRAAHLDADIERMKRAIEAIDQAPISTLHGFCQRMLHDHAFGTRVPFDVELVPDLGELVDDFLHDFWQRRVAAEPPGLGRQLRALGLDVQSLRRLLEASRQNPRIRLVPWIESAPDPDELARALDRARVELARADGLAFVEEHCVKKAYGDGAEMATLLGAVRAQLEQADPRDFHAPKRAERLFLSHVRPNLKKKSSGSVVVPEAFFDAFERLTRLGWQRALALSCRLLAEASTELRRRKTALGVLGFEDLLLLLADALAGEGGSTLADSMRDRFRAVLIDEFQDTDPVQFEIFDRVFGSGKTPLFLIGDPKQAIYGFRGADVFAYLEAGRGARRHTMGTSFRSDPGLLWAVNRLFGPAGTFCIPGIGCPAVAPSPEASNGFFCEHASGPASVELLLIEREQDGAAVTKAVAGRAVARIAAADIARMLVGGATLTSQGVARRVTAADVAVLTRTNAECFTVQEALRDRGINSVVISDKSVLESDEADELGSVLEAVHDPRSADALRRAVTTSLFGLTGDELARRDREPDWWQDQATRFQRWRELWLARGFMPMFRALLDEAGAPANLLAVPGGERRLTNVLHLAELVHRASVEQHLGPSALLRWLVDQRSGKGHGAERAEIRLESDADAVRILTVHKAKGLEFEVVYCPYLWEAFGARSDGPQRFHDRDGRASMDIDLDAAARADNVERAAWEGFAEQMRTAYVALTRAKQRVTVLWGGFNQLGASATALLLHPLDAPLEGHRIPDVGRLAERSDAELAGDLRALCDQSERAVALRSVPWRYDAPALEREARTGEPLAARAVAAPIRSWLRTGSFSGLVQHALPLPAVEDEGRDHDEDVERVDLGPELAAAPPEPVAAVAGRRRIVLDGFPRGAQVGDLFHELLESIDFATVTDDELGALAQPKLVALGAPGSTDPKELERWRGQLVRSVRDVLETELVTSARLRLRDVPLGRRFSELEFRIPVALAGSGAQLAGLSRRRLASVFREHPSPELPADYAERVERLGFPELRGFLKGFVDLVFEHAGRWYLVDYKTNHLGDFVDEYGVGPMTRAMAEAHYFLQYHLYLVALERHLHHWLPGWDYQRDFGGVLYLFLRGMRPDAGSRSGIFFEKPPASRLRALSSLLDGVPVDAAAAAPGGGA